MISGLLYQEYRDKSTLQEIETRRQQDAEIQANARGPLAGEGSPEGDEDEDGDEEEEEPASPPERKALPQICLLSNPHSRFNLWQDLPEIRSSGVLEILQAEEIKLQEVNGCRGLEPLSERTDVLTFLCEVGLPRRITDGVCLSRTRREVYVTSQATKKYLVAF